MPESQDTGNTDARNPKRQLIDEVQALRRQLTAARRKAPGATKGTNEKKLQIEFDELRDEYALLSELVDIAADAIVSIDKDQHIIRFNQGAERVFGYSREEVIGSPLTMLLPRKFRAAHKSHVRNFQRSDSRSRLMDQRGKIAGRKKDGTTFPAIATITYAIYKGAPTMTVFLRDISEITRAEERSQKSMEELVHVGRVNMLGEIAASLAHEVNQPLTAILANAQTIQKQITASPAVTEEIIESISDVVSDAKRAGEVVQRLRFMSEYRENHPELVDLNRLIIDTEMLLRSQLIMSQIQLDLELCSDLPVISCDPVQLQQVLLNLLTNAIDATAKSGPTERSVLIRTDQSDSGVIKISFRDSGTGIRNKSFQNIFEPFFTTKKNGMGMGLAISRSILQVIDGRLSAKNNSGPGATFCITLPAPGEQVNIPEDLHAIGSGPEVLHNGFVFIVDDDASIRKSLGRLIRSGGYQVETFASADEFQRRDEYVGVGCIVVDLHMPGASGLKLQKEIRKRRGNLPMIFITGAGDTASSVHAMKHGASDFLMKPVDEDKMLGAIARAIKQSRVARKQETQYMAAQERVARLTPRETEIMDLIVKGMRNKQVAGMLGISEKTVKVHRGRVMQKVGARTVADLVRVAETASMEFRAAP